MRFPDVLDDLLIFINAFLLLSGQNRLVAIASHPARSPPPPILLPPTTSAQG